MWCNFIFKKFSGFSNLEELLSGSELSTDLPSEDYTEQPDLSTILTVVKDEDIIAVPENPENVLTEGSDNKEEQSRQKRQISNDDTAFQKEAYEQLKKEFTRVSSGLLNEHTGLLKQVDTEVEKSISNLPKEHQDLIKQMQALQTKVLSGQLPVEHRGIDEDNNDSEMFRVFKFKKPDSGSSQLSPMLSLTAALLLFVGLTRFQHHL